MSDITLYGFAPSSYTWSARLVAEEKGISHDLEPLEFGSSEHIAMNPFAKIPVMKHGDFILYETSAICRYIDETFDGPPLQAGTPADRAIMEQWNSAFVDHFYDSCVRSIVIQRLVVPNRGGEPDEEMIANATPKARHALRVVDEALKKSPYLAGENPTISDFILLPIAFYSAQVPESEQTIAGLSALEEWLGKMQSRASFSATAPNPA